ncbi:MAG TPA: serine hydrolase domain-containing protein [Thermoanaerobaculia bacterium]|nr:serine hydrolase domain-containing protein [Thermoanaerobaculia bacterium]
MKRTTRRSGRLLVAAVLLCGVGLVAGAAASGQPAERPPAGPPSPDLQSPRARAVEYLEELRRASGAPGLSAAVVARGRLLFAEGFGFADLEHRAPATSATVYNIGSVAKAITAVAVLQLVEEGKVGLEDAVQRYVPAFPEKGWPVTVRHLMTHTSGIRHYRASDFPDESPHEMNWRPYGSVEEAIAIFAGDPLLFAPGTHYHYTSYGVNLLQGVVEAASGMGFEDYLRRRVWEPAGMLRTSFDVPARLVPHRARGYLLDGTEVHNHPWEDVSYKWAGGGMISTAEDLARLGAALLDGRLMAPATVRRMFAPQLGEDVLVFQGDEPAAPLRWRQALIWRIRTDLAGRDFVHHCGSVKGFNACLVLYVDEGLVVATADNADALGFGPALTLADLFRKPAAAPGGAP